MMTEHSQTAVKLLLAGTSALGILFGWFGLSYAEQEKTAERNAASSEQAAQTAAEEREAQAIAHLRYVAASEQLPLRQVTRYAQPKRVYTRSSD